MGHMSHKGIAQGDLPAPGTDVNITEFFNLHCSHLLRNQSSFE